VLSVEETFILASWRAGDRPLRPVAFRANEVCYALHTRRWITQQIKTVLTPFILSRLRQMAVSVEHQGTW